MEKRATGGGMRRDDGCCKVWRGEDKAVEQRDSRGCLERGRSGVEEIERGMLLVPPPTPPLLFFAFVPLSRDDRRVG